jgi:Xaa-Pro aminopeptidase
VHAAHSRLLQATHAAFDAAHPGRSVADLFHAMSPALGAQAVPGRRGHGLGMHLTEGASLLARDATVLRPGMVLTLEPAIETGPGRIMVHEECIAITQTGAAWLSPPAPETLPQLDGTP